MLLILKDTYNIQGQEQNLQFSWITQVMDLILSIVLWLSIVISLISLASVKEYQGGISLIVLSQFFFFPLLGAN